MNREIAWIDHDIHFEIKIQRDNIFFEKVRLLAEEPVLRLYTELLLIERSLFHPQKRKRDANPLRRSAELRCWRLRRTLNRIEVRARAGVFFS